MKGCACDQRVGGKARIGSRIAHHQDVVTADGVVAKGHRPGCLFEIRAGARLHDLHLRLDQRHERHLDLEARLGLFADLVEGRRGGRGQKTRVPEGQEASGLVCVVVRHSELLRPSGA
jgi:hypothetical protein